MNSRSQAETIWGQAGAHFAALVDAAVDAMIVIDDRGTVLTFNAAAKRMFGYSEEEILGGNVRDLMPEPHRSQHDEYLRRYLETGEARIIGIGREAVGRRKDGFTFPIEISVGEVADQDPRRFVGIVRDVSDRKRAESEALELQQRLTQLARFSTVGEMAAGLAHEINQPLAAISMYAQALARKVNHEQHPASVEIGGICGKIADQAQRAGEVIRHLRGMLRAQAAARAQVDGNAIIEEVLVLAELDARERGVPLRLDLTEDLPRVNGSAMELQQVILNLIRNAVDAMSEVENRAAGVTITTRSIDNQVQFSVIDRGRGVDESITQDIFHPFVSSKPDGLGVGLAVSQNIVQSHGGKLEYAPNPEGGAIFRFTLPVSFED